MNTIKFLSMLKSSVFVSFFTIIFTIEYALRIYCTQKSIRYAKYTFLVKNSGISLSLNFPVVKYINSASRKRVARLASTVALIIFSYSIYTFVQLYRQNTFEQNSTKFINDLRICKIVN